MLSFREQEKPLEGVPQARASDHCKEGAPLPSNGAPDREATCSEQKASSKGRESVVAPPLSDDASVVGKEAIPRGSSVVFENMEEVQATTRMYLAHQSLRSEQVSDPDSEENRRIKESMIRKALLQDGAPRTAR